MLLAHLVAPSGLSNFELVAEDFYPVVCESTRQTPTSPDRDVNFSTYSVFYDPEAFITLLRNGKQREQVWKLLEIHPLCSHQDYVPAMRDMLVTLYQGGKDQYTPAELAYLRGTTFHWMYVERCLQGVLSTLYPSVFHGFYIWVTLPLDLMNAKISELSTTDAMYLSGSDAVWSGGVLDFAFSPRSAMLFFTYGLRNQDRRQSNTLVLVNFVPLAFDLAFSTLTRLSMLLVSATVGTLITLYRLPLVKVLLCI